MADAQTPANVQHSGGKGGSSLQDTDPTVLTTQQLWREIAALKELLLTKIEAINNEIALAHQDSVRFPTNIDKEITHLKNINDEKFKAMETALQGEHNLKEEKFNKVDQRFMLMETIRIEQKKESNSSLLTALHGAKDVIDEQSKNMVAVAAKSEAALMKQIDQQFQIIQSINKSLEDKISDIKDRITKIEGVSLGKKDFWGYIVGAIGLLATLATLIGMMIKNSIR